MLRTCERSFPIPGLVKAYALAESCVPDRSQRMTVTAASSQRFVVSYLGTVPQIVMTVRLPGNARAATLRTAKPLRHAQLGCEMEEQRDRQHYVSVRD